MRPTSLAIITAVAAGVTAGGPAAVAATTFKTGGDLLLLCQSDLEADTARCTGYIMALNDAAALLTTEFNQAPLYCASSQVTEERLRLTFVQRAGKRSPAVLQGSAAAAFYDAMAQAYPCQR